MGAVKAVLRAVTGLVSIVVGRNNLFERAGERSYQAPLSENSSGEKPEAS